MTAPDLRTAARAVCDAEETLERIGVGAISADQLPTTYTTLFEAVDVLRAALAAEATEPPPDGLSLTGCRYVFGPYQCVKVPGHEDEHVGAREGVWELRAAAPASDDDDVPPAIAADLAAHGLMPYAPGISDVAGSPPSTPAPTREQDEP